MKNEPTIQKVIGNNIARRLKELNKKPEELYNAIYKSPEEQEKTKKDNYAYRVAYNWINGNFKTMDVVMLNEICKQLEVSLDYIVGNQEVMHNANINANECTGFDDNILYNIGELKSWRHQIDVIDPERIETYDILCSLLGTENGIRLLNEISYRIQRFQDYPAADVVRTSDYAGVGNWQIKKEDLIASDNMQLFQMLLNWINNYKKDFTTQQVTNE